MMNVNGNTNQLCNLPDATATERHDVVSVEIVLQLELREEIFNLQY